MKGPVCKRCMRSHFEAGEIRWMWIKGISSLSSGSSSFLRQRAVNRGRTRLHRGPDYVYGKQGESEKQAAHRGHT